MNQIKEYIIERISSSLLINEPFEHKFIQNIFPDQYYKDLLTNLPLKSDYIPIIKTETVTPNYSPERFIFNLLDKDNVNKLNHKKKNFIYELINILLSKELFMGVTKAFSTTIDKRLKKLTDYEKEKIGDSNFKFSIRTSLVKDLTKYNLGAHTDNVNKLISFLFYLPVDNTLSSIGTSLYKPITELSHNTHKYFTSTQTKKNFKKIKTCPFISNSLFLFPRTQSSYHGVEEVNIDQKERNLLLLNYYIQKNDQ